MDSLRVVFVMREGVVVALVLGAVLTAGCMGAFGESQDRMVFGEFATNNSTSETYTFEVFLLNEPAEVRYTELNGRTYAAVTQGGMYIEESPKLYANIQPQSGRHYGNFTLNGTQSISPDIELAPSQDMIFVVVYGERDQIMGYISATCLWGPPRSFIATVDTGRLVGDYGC